MSKIDRIEAAAPTHDAVARLRREPRFADACATVIDGIVGHYRGNWVLNRVLNDRARVLMGLLILDLHYNWQREGGLTATLLKQQCVEHGVCSPGRVTAMLGLLRAFGFLAEAPVRDRRVRRLVPTEKMLVVHRARWLHFFEALALMSAEGRAALLRLQQPDFMAAHIAVAARLFRGGMRMIDYAPELRPVVGRDVGVVLLLSLVSSARAADPAPGEPLPVTISELAMRFSVSRGHVLTILRDAAQTGLIIRSGARAEGIAVTPALIDAAERFVAAGLLVHAASMRAGLAGRYASAG